MERDDTSTANHRLPRLPELVSRVISIAAVLSIVATAPLAAQQEEASTSHRLLMQTNAQWIGQANWLHATDTPANPGNQFLELPRNTWLTELRVDGRIEAGPRWLLIVRPRVIGSIASTTTDAEPKELTSDAECELTEMYLGWRPTDSIAITYGLQNFQWGPAEMMGASNRLFHEVGVFRDASYVVRGKNLARVNISSGKQWSVVALAELASADEVPFRADAPFRRAGQAKFEYSTESGASYAGATVGVRDGEPPWFGAYTAITLTDALSVYLDTSLQHGSQAWYPVAASDGSIAFATSERSSGMNKIALAGMRYTYSASFDARLEYLRQDAGYTREQVTNAGLAVAQNPSSETVERWLSPGLEFLGRDLVLVSVQARDIPPAERLDLHGRYIRSLTDGSGAAFLTGSVDVHDSLVVFCSLILAHGPELSEFTRIADAGVSGGFIWSW